MSHQAAGLRGLVGQFKLDGTYLTSDMPAYRSSASATVQYSRQSDERKEYAATGTDGPAGWTNEAPSRPNLVMTSTEDTNPFDEF